MLFIILGFIFLLLIGFLWSYTLYRKNPNKRKMFDESGIPKIFTLISVVGTYFSIGTFLVFYKNDIFYILIGTLWLFMGLKVTYNEVFKNET